MSASKPNPLTCFSISTTPNGKPRSNRALALRLMVVRRQLRVAMVTLVQRGVIGQEILVALKGGTSHRDLALDVRILVAALRLLALTDEVPDAGPEALAIADQLARALTVGIDRAACP